MKFVNSHAQPLSPVRRKTVSMAPTGCVTIFAMSGSLKLDKGDFVFHLASSISVIEEPAPEMSKAYLSVKSNVSGASVLIDGHYMGSTNLFNVEIVPGDHQIQVDKDGYEPYTRRVQFEKGRTKDLYVALDPKALLKCRLYVDTQPDNARVRILNISPAFYQGMALNAGRYHVEVSANGHETQKMWVTLVSGEDKSIDVRLKKKDIPLSSYSSYGVVEDSYLKIAALDIKKSGNKAVNIQLKYQNKTDKEIKIKYAGPHAFLSDNLGNESTGWGMIPGFNLPPNGSKSVGLRFEFSSYKVQKLGGKLGNEFSLTIKHTSSPPGQVSFTGLKTNNGLNKQDIPPSSYSSPDIVEDSYLKIAALDIKQSGNNAVNIRLKYQNKTDKEITIKYAGPHAFLSDNLGNESTGWGTIPGFNLPPNGSKSVGLRFEFNSYKVQKLGGQLGNEFSLTIKHTSSPPGQVSFLGLKTKYKR